MLDRTQGKRKLTKLASLLLLLTPIQTTWDSTDMARNVDLATGGIDLSPAGHPLSILSTCFILITRFSRVPGRFVPVINNNYNACFYGRQTSSNFKFRQGSLFRSPNHAELVSTSTLLLLCLRESKDGLLLDRLLRHLLGLRYMWDIWCGTCEDIRWVISCGSCWVRCASCRAESNRSSTSTSLTTPKSFFPLPLLLSLAHL